jgi:hypothetical protein
VTIFATHVPEAERARGATLMLELMAEHAIRYMTVKHRAFEAEGESRCFLVGDSSEPTLVREQYGMLVPYVAVPLWSAGSPPAVSAVRNGPTQVEERGRVAVRSLWDASDYGAASAGDRYVRSSIPTAFTTTIAIEQEELHMTDDAKRTKPFVTLGAVPAANPRDSSASKTTFKTDTIDEGDRPDIAPDGVWLGGEDSPVLLRGSDRPSVELKASGRSLLERIVASSS